MADELVYVSWGGTGRGEALRAAMQQASAAGKGLVYLAVLDDAHFADLDDGFLAVVKDELEWLLDAQLEVTKAQLGVDDLPVRVLIRSGDVVDQAADAVATVGDTTVIIGAPVPLADHESVDALLGELRDRVSVPVVLSTGGEEIRRPA